MAADMAASEMLDMPVSTKQASARRPYYNYY
jgi:hypothetical protein